MDLNRQRLEELVATLSIYGDALQDVMPAEFLQAAHAICEGDLTAADAALAAHGPCSCSGRLHLQTESSSAHTHATPLSANLVFTMPHDYPAAAALQCHVTSEGLPRHTVDTLSQQMQQQAVEAEGTECLHELAASLQEELNQLQQQQQQQQLDFSHQQQQQQLAQGKLQQQQDPQGGFRRVLLRLDHMRDRAGYTAIIKQWASELQLTGWLLFWQPLILILLEGSSRDISTYLCQARTVCVDVDSYGRKCRERMLTILDDMTNNAGISSTERLDSAELPIDGSSTKFRAFSDFRELNPATLEDVVQQLSGPYPKLDGQALRKMLGLA